MAAGDETSPSLSADVESNEKKQRRDEPTVTICLIVLSALTMELIGVTPAFARLFEPWVGSRPSAAGLVVGAPGALICIAIYGVVWAVPNPMSGVEPDEPAGVTAELRGCRSFGDIHFFKNGTFEYVPGLCGDAP